MNARILACLLLGTFAVGALAPLEVDLQVNRGVDPPSTSDRASATGTLDDSVGIRSDLDSVTPPGPTHVAAPSATQASVPAEGHGPRSAPNAYQAFLVRLAEPKGFDAQIVTVFFQDYYRAIGFDVASSDFQGWEENATLSFTYPIGDVNADGVDDLAMNTYCVAPDACGTMRPTNSPLPDINAAGTDPCLPPGTGASLPILNRLYGIDGRTGGGLWQRNQSERRWSADDAASYLAHALGRELPLGLSNWVPVALGCPFDFVVGTVPRADGSGNDLLVHRVTVATYAASDPYRAWTSQPYEGYGSDGEASPHQWVQAAIVHHEVYLVDRADGRTVWSRGWDGHYVKQTSQWGSGAGRQKPVEYVAGASNFAVNPILQIPPGAGARILPANTQPALFLQGVGFNATYAQTVVALPGWSQTMPVLESYQPREWAARLNLTTGQSMWINQRTFGPTLNRSVVPLALPGRPATPWDAPFANRSYWSYTPCCFDANGDGLPDLPFVTIEWSATPVYDTAGPLFVASRLFEFDGATGRPLWSVDVETGTQRYEHEEFADAPAYQTYFETLGDADGDGGSDILLHQVYYQENYRHVLSVRSGRTGEEVWRLDRARDIADLVLGRVPGSRGNALVVIEWHDYEFPNPQVYHALNVTALKLTLYEGATGRRLWNRTVETFAAPIDVAASFHNFKVNGLPDLDDDGVGDIPVDDPVILPDIEIVHRISYLSGSHGTPILKIDTVGSLALIAYAGDLNGDGTDDFACVNGNIIDLWITFYEGRAGAPLWSRRILTPPIADYQSALPYLRFIPLNTPDHAKTSILLNFHLEIGAKEGTRRTFATYPQVVAFEANGSVPWALPRLTDSRVQAVVQGETSGAKAYHHMLQAENQPHTAAAQATHWVADRGVATLGLYVATVGLAFPVAKFVLARRRR